VLIVSDNWLNQHDNTLYILLNTRVYPDFWVLTLTLITNNLLDPTRHGLKRNRRNGLLDLAVFSR